MSAIALPPAPPLECGTAQISVVLRCWMPEHVSNLQLQRSPFHASADLRSSAGAQFATMHGLFDTPKTLGKLG